MTRRSDPRDSSSAPGAGLTQQTSPTTAVRAHPPTDRDGATLRPELSTSMTGAELRRWYWLRAELADLARRRGISTAGSKQQLTDRLVAVLDGDAMPPAAPRRRPAAARQLEGVLSLQTVIPAGQRCSQLLRAFFAAQVGAGFTFDAAMRSFITQGAGATLGDAIAYWHSSRSAGSREIGSQFELNRFTRQWYVDHPGGTRAELHQAWTVYRNTPTDQRGRA